MDVSSKRIAFVIGSMGRGGAERVISILANDYAQNGWEVDILLLLRNECAYELSSTINVIDVSGDRTSRWLRLPMWIGGIRRYAKQYRPNVVVAFAARINIITQVSLAYMNIPVVVSERNDPYKDGRGTLVNIMTKWLYPKAEAVVFQTKRAKSYFPTLDNACIISNPIEVHSVRKDVLKNRIVTVGRLAEQKNQKMLIEAFAKVHEKHPDYTLDIYGEGHLRDSLQQLISELKLDDIVTLKGVASDIHEQIADAKLFVLSSDYEGLSNALLEAMMMGLPCISTSCAGSDEYIRHGESGILVEVGNSSAMSDAMVYMITHVDVANQMGEYAKIMSNEFARPNVIRQWNKVISNIII